jgi:hypothetical protein
MEVFIAEHPIFLSSTIRNINIGAIENRIDGFLQKTTLSN